MNQTAILIELNIAEDGKHQMTNEDKSEYSRKSHLEKRWHHHLRSPLPRVEGSHLSL